jgi:hypothetical protein
MTTRHFFRTRPPFHSSATFLCGNPLRNPKFLSHAHGMAVTFIQGGMGISASAGGFRAVTFSERRPTQTIVYL